MARAPALWLFHGLSSPDSECLDLFAAIGALRRESDEEITTRFLRAYAEDADLAMRTLFFARDIRGGIGERRVFRIILKWLAANEPQSLERNIPYIAEYGRYDDLLALISTSCDGKALQYIKRQLAADCAALETGDSVSLLAKWLPSVNASNEGTVRQAKYIAHALGMNDARYRKTLSALRAKISIIENILRERDYTFDYSKQPSKAMFKYRKAFMRNDGERYGNFINRVAEGVEQIHTGTLTPYEMIKPFFNGGTLSDAARRAVDVTSDCSLTNFAYAKQLFAKHGYQLPEVVFWNVASRNQQQPVTQNEQGVALVSGCGPRIFSMLKSGILSPYALMLDVLNSERYQRIAA